ncbi:hypothetical protein [Leifsonia shinshuensis]|uniref:hypothetical protein n=1 Tax=Leifsonia shinshuensis TaxID=150026 RepID=UPI002863F824|nr:hypothetical protein [Leifsonia shinshuensis]MDR6969752.1 peptidoglycan/LPS O-acetylase OafA/YrhL [Leifsonia shinshuensis]
MVSRHSAVRQRRDTILGWLLIAAGLLIVAAGFLALIFFPDSHGASLIERLPRLPAFLAGPAGVAVGGYGARLLRRRSGPAEHNHDR